MRKLSFLGQKRKFLSLETKKWCKIYLFRKTSYNGPYFPLISPIYFLVTLPGFTAPGPSICLFISPQIYHFFQKNLSFHFSTNLKMCISSWSQQLVQEDSFVHIKILKCVCFFFVNLFYVSLILRPSYKTWVEGSFFSVCFIMYSFILLEYNKNTPILCMNGIHTCLVSDYFKKVLLKTCLYMSFGTCKQVLFWNIYVQKLNCCIGEYVWLKIS